MTNKRYPKTIYLTPEESVWLVRYGNGKASDGIRRLIELAMIAETDRQAWLRAQEKP